MSSDERTQWLRARQEAELARTGCIYCEDRDPKVVVGMDGPVWCGECDKKYPRCRVLRTRRYIGDKCDEGN